MHVSTCVCVCDRGKRDLGADEDTGVVTMERAWEKAWRGEEREEQEFGGGVGGVSDLSPLASAGQFPRSICSDLDVSGRPLIV